MTVDRGAKEWPCRGNSEDFGCDLSMFPRITSSRARAAVIVALIAVAAVAYWAWPSGVRSKAEIGATASANAPGATARTQGSVDLSDSQLASVKVQPVEDHEFPVEKDA